MATLSAKLEEAIAAAEGTAGLAERVKALETQGAPQLAERVATLESSITVLIDTVSKLIDVSPLRPIAPVKVH